MAGAGAAAAAADSGLTTDVDLDSGFIVYQDEESGKSYRYPRRLFVGEADFSYTRALLTKHLEAKPGLARSITATELNTKEKLEELYGSTFPGNFKYIDEKLENLDAQLLFGVDAKLLHQHSMLEGKRYPIIQFNCPHVAGDKTSPTKKKETRLMLKKFFQSARKLQKDGDTIQIVLSVDLDSGLEAFRQRWIYGIYDNATGAGYVPLVVRPFQNIRDGYQYRRFDGYQHRISDSAGSADVTDYLHEIIFIRTGLTYSEIEKYKLSSARMLKDKYDKPLRCLPAITTDDELSEGKSYSEYCVLEEGDDSDEDEVLGSLTTRATFFRRSPKRIADFLFRRFKDRRMWIEYPESDFTFHYYSGSEKKEKKCEGDERIKMRDFSKFAPALLRDERVFKVFWNKYKVNFTWRAEKGNHIVGVYSEGLRFIAAHSPFHCSVLLSHPPIIEAMLDGTRDDEDSDWTYDKEPLIQLASRGPEFARVIFEKTEDLGPLKVVRHRFAIMMLYLIDGETTFEVFAAKIKTKETLEKIITKYPKLWAKIESQHDTSVLKDKFLSADDVGDLEHMMEQLGRM